MKTKMRTITIVCRDEERNLESLLRYIQETARIGHSFPVVVDPTDSEFRRTYTIDGDGADKIDTITVTES